MKILVIIVTYNAMQWAERCFKSLQNSTMRPDVFVVDNGSTDGTQGYIRKHFPFVELIESETNLGFGRANNIGLRKALQDGYEFVYLLNQDAWVLPDTFERLIKVSESNPEYGVLSPIQMQADMKHMDGKFARNVLGNHQKSYPLLVEDLYFGNIENVYSVDYVMAAHWFITRKCLETVGVFSPTFPHYGEDNNYLDRVIYWNLKIGVVPSSKAIHDRADSNWNDKKNQYMKYFVIPLRAASNPLGARGMFVTILINIFYFFRDRRIAAFKYTLRLINNCTRIRSNFKLSLKTGAFINS